MMAPERLPIDRRGLRDRLARLLAGPRAGMGAGLAELCHPDLDWRGSHPLNRLTGLAGVEAQVWKPLLHAFPDLERRDLIFVAGSFEGRDYIAAMGHYCGVFEADWLGIPATGRPAFLRYGEVHEIRDGRIVQSNCLWDLLDLVRQAGHWPVAPSLGVEGMWPGPITGDGLRDAASDPSTSAASIAQTLAMHAALGAYDDAGDAGPEGLLNMPQRAFWHPRMMWYGPAGIGATRGLAGFVDDHQLPFRLAFPNRKGGGQWDEIAEAKAALGGGHYIRIGDGSYSVTGGWPSVFAIHSGGGFLGMGPTQRAVSMRVMDFYLHDEGLIRENWVPLDMLDLLHQMGVDVLGRLRHKLRK